VRVIKEMASRVAPSRATSGFFELVAAHGVRDSLGGASPPGEASSSGGSAGPPPDTVDVVAGVAQVFLDARTDRPPDGGTVVSTVSHAMQACVGSVLQQMLQRIRDTEAEPVEAASIVAQMRSIILIRLGESGCDGAEAVTMDPDVSDALDTYLDIAIDEGLRKAAPGPTVDITTHLTDAHTESLEAYSLESIEALDQKVQAAIKETREWGKKLAEDASAKAPSLSSAQLRQKERALRLAESQSA
jgi:hypothetical protein